MNLFNKINPADIGKGDRPSDSQLTEYEFLVTDIQKGTLYEYRLADVDVNGMVEYSSSLQVVVGQVSNVEMRLSSTPPQFKLQPAFLTHITTEYAESADNSDNTQNSSHQ